MLVFTFFMVFFSAHAQNSPTICKPQCGANTTLQFPFGFSDGCEIQLTCKDNKTVKIGEFEVKKVTSNNILLHFPADCHRHINKSDELISPNYAPTNRNNFLIRKCSQPVNNCSIQAKSFEDRLSINTCKLKDDDDADNDDSDDDVSCYSEKNTSVVNELKKRTKCSVLFTSILINLNKSVDSVVLALEFEVVELEWWLLGNCSCAKDAKRVNVSIAGGKTGCRCQCKAGLEGDGFSNGGGCRRG